MSIDKDFLIAECLARGVLRFGDFTLKSGRKSPYFFNIGEIYDSKGLSLLAESYASLLANYPCDVLFGPAYKGISLSAITATSLWNNHAVSVNWACNRKEKKDHGEKGLLIGAPLQGKVVIVDDVLTAGTAIRQAMQTIHQHGGQAVAVALFLDRQEAGSHAACASDELRKQGLDVLCALTLDDIIRWLQRHPNTYDLQAMLHYRDSL